LVDYEKVDGVIPGNFRSGGRSAFGHAASRGKGRNDGLLPKGKAPGQFDKGYDVQALLCTQLHGPGTGVIRIFG